MDFFSRTKAVAWTIAILVILNLCALGTVWYQQMSRPRGTPPREREKEGRRVSRFLKKELGLTEKQQEQVKALQKNFFSSVGDIRRTTNKLRRAIMQELTRGTPDMKRVDSLAGKIGKEEARRERLLFNHFEEIKSVCDPEQREKFNSLVGKLARMMSEPGHHGPPARRGRRGPSGRRERQGQPATRGHRRPPGQGMPAGSGPPHEPRVEQP